MSADNFSWPLVEHENEDGKAHEDVSEEQRQRCNAEDQMWSLVASTLAFDDQMRSKFDRISIPDDQLQSKLDRIRFPDIDFNPEVLSYIEPFTGRPIKQKSDFTKDDLAAKILSMDMKINGGFQKSGLLSAGRNVKVGVVSSTAGDKRFKSLPFSEMLPRNEPLGGYIFVCNNDTMQEDLKRRLFGLPQRYRDSVRAIQPGLPLFLYNYTAHQLHGIFESTSFGGSNIDPTAWEDKKCKGESRFPAQVRTRVRKLCKPLEEDAFRPVLYHYDGPKFRLQLSVPETLALLDLFSKNGTI